MKKHDDILGPQLLMLVHGELHGLARLRLEAHLLCCPSCRNQRKRLGSLSVSLSRAFTNPSLGHRTFVKASGTAWILALSFLVLAPPAAYLAVSAKLSSSASADTESLSCPATKGTRNVTGRHTNRKIARSRATAE
jgi:anti-sigma factor RsiW